MELQVWKKIEGYERYSVSACGSVRNDKTGRLLSQNNNYGYTSVKLYKGQGVSNRRMVHRLVALSFIPLVEGKVYVDHINEDKSDNRAENLRRCTQKENINFYCGNHLELDAFPIVNILETPEEKELRLKEVSITLGKEKGTLVVVDGKYFDAVRQAARYIFKLESTRGKESTIRKEIQRVCNGKRKPFTMYGRFTIGF